MACLPPPSPELIACLNRLEAKYRARRRCKVHWRRLWANRDLEAWEARQGNERTGVEILGLVMRDRDGVWHVKLDNDWGEKAQAHVNNDGKGFPHRVLAKRSLVAFAYLV